jgi:phage minor structural protein
VLYVLNNKEAIVGVLSNEAPFACPYFDDEHIENIQTGVHTFDFSVPASHETAEKLEVEGYILLKDLDGKIQMFKIKDIEEVAASQYTKRISTEHSAVSELLTDVVRPAELLSYTLENALLYVLDGTGYELGDIDFIESKDVIFEDYATVLEAVLQIAEIFGAEIQFEVTFINGQITKRIVHMQEKRGRITKKLFSYGKDLVDVKRTENSEGLITALIPFGKGDQAGNRLTLAGFEWTSSNGFYTEKDKDYIENPEALQMYGRNGKHIFGVYSDSNATSTVVLYQNAQKELEYRSRPRLTFECTVATLERITGYSSEEVRVGDTVTIKDTTFTPVLVLEARIIEVKRSYTAPENDAVVLGDYKPIKISDNPDIKRIQRIITAKQEHWEATSHQVEITSSTGLIFKGTLNATTLNARVYSGGADITDTLPAASFRWTRKTTDTASDNVWNTNNGIGVKSITVTDEELIGSTTFNCEVVI